MSWTSDLHCCVQQPELLLTWCYYSTFLFLLCSVSLRDVRANSCFLSFSALAWSSKVIQSSHLFSLKLSKAKLTMASQDFFEGLGWNKGFRQIIRQVALQAIPKATLDHGLGSKDQYSCQSESDQEQSMNILKTSLSTEIRLDRSWSCPSIQTFILSSTMI